ncbi:hypothetical protein [Streptomyces cavernae]|uniref:hypothetical protein n=1 Tax=Streptomyces cavernae TaxID=2259034 RepID=UPI000FEBD4A8|nr:hypothetical protein [Streptomyces cavernae]
MSGSLWIPPGAGPDTLPYVPRQSPAPGRAVSDPVGELASRLEEFIAAAVHPDEIAALLESDGMSDDQIRERYGCKDSFTLATELYARVERRHPEPDGPSNDPWRISLLSCLLRGVVFALPGLGYILGAPLLNGARDPFALPAGTIPLLASAVFGWAWNQGLSHRAYSWLGLGDRAAARRSLLVGAPAGATLASLCALAVAPDRPGAVAFATGQSWYLAAATVLLVMGRERALLTALTPLAAGTALAALHDLGTTARVTLLLGSVAAVVVLAARETLPTTRDTEHGQRIDWAAGFAGLPAIGRPGTGAHRKPPARAVRDEGLAATPWLVAALPYALFGLGSGILVLFASLADLLTGQNTEGFAAPAAVALTLSMGPAEWLLHHFRSRSLTGLRASNTTQDFARATAANLARCLTAYLALLLVLSLATAALWPDATGLDTVRLAGLLLLGVVLWTGLLLQSFGAVMSAAVVCCAAALAQSLALATDAAGPATTGLIVHGTSAAVLAGLVGTLLGKVTAHR